jgi:hypothetical protein
MNTHLSSVGGEVSDKSGPGKRARKTKLARYLARSSIEIKGNGLPGCFKCLDVLILTKDNAVKTSLNLGHHEFQWSNKAIICIDTETRI